MWVSRRELVVGVQNCPGRQRGQEGVLGTNSTAGGGKPCDGTSPAGFLMTLSSRHTVRCCVCV